MSTPAALACVSATSDSGTEWRTSVAPTRTTSRPVAGSMSAVRMQIGESISCPPLAERPISASAPE